MENLPIPRNPGGTEHAQCVPGSFLSAHTLEPGNEANIVGTCCGVTLN